MQDIVVIRMLDKKTKIIAIGGLITMAVLIAFGMTAQGSDTELVIQRTRMREIAITFNSVDGVSASCEVYQRIMFWQEYEYAMSFDIDSGETFNINMDVLAPIYRDMKFICESGDRTIAVNTVFAMGALIIQEAICPEQSCPITTTTIPITCEEQGYIFPENCGSCDSCCEWCQKLNEHCTHDWECCKGLYCQWSSHKCKNIWW